MIKPNLLDTFKVRRRFAQLAFLAILVTLASCLLIAFFGDADSANRLREAGIIIAPIIVCLTGVIGQYAHLVFKQDNRHVEQV